MEVTYEPPSVTELGTLADLTRAHKSSGVLDFSYPAGTPGPDGLFS